jgi:hypothetical protein
MSEEHKGLKYLKNLVSVNTEIHNKLEKLLPEVESNKPEDAYTRMIVDAGMKESLLRIVEATRAARQIFDVDLELQENVLNFVDNIQPSFYLKDDKVHTQNGMTIEEALTLITTAFKEKYPEQNK